MSIAYRTATVADLPFVVDSWSRSYRTSYSAGLIQMEDWRELMERQIRLVLAREGVRLIVAFNPDVGADSGVDVHGWIAYERGFQIPGRVHEGGRWQRRMVDAECPLVHYVYVKNSYRGHGVARGLFAAAEIDPLEPFFYTCKTPAAADAHGKIPMSDWNPLIARHTKQRTPNRRKE